MKICIFTESFYRGGLDTFIANLVSSWPRNEDSFTLVLNETHPSKEYFIERFEKKITVETYDYARLWSYNTQTHLSFHFWLKKMVSWALYYIFYYPLYVYKLYTYFKICDFDRLIIVNGGHPGSLVCRVSGIAWRVAKGKKLRSIYTIHNLPSYHILPSFAQKIVYSLEYIVDFPLSKCVSSIRTVSKTCFESFAQVRPIFHSGKFDYIYNGIQDPSLSEEGRLSAGVLDSHYCLMLASFEPRKGHKYLFDAFLEVSKKMPDIKLIVCGSGSNAQFDEINKMVICRQLEKRVLVKHYIENPVNLIANASVVLVPSIEFESFGLTVIEAMAMSVPVIVTDSGGPAEIISRFGGGIICSAENPNEFAEAIIKILTNKHFAHAIGVEGRKSFERHFLASKMSKEYCSLLSVD